jgi:hypothetical protein
MLPSFPAAPKATFKLLNKLDLAFASLITGTNADTGETLSGFGLGGSSTLGVSGVSVTEKVRIKSLVDQTRLVVVKVMEGSVDEMEEEEEEEEMEDDDVDEEIVRMEMSITRVYDRTVTELGHVLGGSPIGIVTSDDEMNMS